MPQLFISLDGLDGTGKSTQCRLLADWMRCRGLSVTECIDPGGTPVGADVRAIVLGHRHDLSPRAEALLFMASRAELVERVIRPALAVGGCVVSDRFLLANVVYQGHAGGLDLHALRLVGEFATGGLEPDLTIVLDLPVAAAVARRGREPDRMEQRDRAYHERVRAGFLAEARRRPDRVRVVDAAGEVDAVQRAVRAEVGRLMGEGDAT
jgi:dTMP kinase